MPNPTIGVYKGKQYRVLWSGRTKTNSLRARLGFLESTHEFWVDAQDVKINGVPASVIVEGQEAVKMQRLEASQAAEAVNTDPSLIPTKTPLYPFQAAGVEYALKTRNVLFADEQGLGKTGEALGTLVAATAANDLSYPALVICPSTLKLNWIGEIEKFSGRRALYLEGAPPSDKEFLAAEVVVINYEMLGPYERVLLARKWQSLIVDESQYIKNKGAKRSKLVEKLSNLPLKFRLFLTGTPVLNRPLELVHPLRCLKVIGDKKEDMAPMGTVWNFLQRYCGAKRTQWGWDFSGATNTGELGVRLRQTCMIRRTKAQVLKELPPKTRQTIPVRLSNWDEYERIEKKFFEWLEDQMLARPELKDLSMAEIMQRLLEIKETNAETMMQMTALRGATGRGKVEAAVAWINDFLESGEKLVVFAYHRPVQQALKVAFPGALTIYADDSLKARQASVDAFQNDSTKKLILVSLRAGQTGITLTAASNMLLVEYDWTPSNMEQAEDRIHRISQQLEFPCLYTYLHGQDTFDDTMTERLSGKRGVINSIMGPVEVPKVEAQESKQDPFDGLFADEDEKIPF